MGTWASAREESVRPAQYWPLILPGTLPSTKIGPFVGYEKREPTLKATPKVSSESASNSGGLFATRLCRGRPYERLVWENEFQMGSENSTNRGRSGEANAVRFLLDAGYTVVTRNYKAPHGEIDIVALDDDTVVFVEVKVRKGGDARAENAISELKLTRLHNAARHYMAAMEDTRDSRFDLIAIDDDGLRHHVGIA